MRITFDDVKKLHQKKYRSELGYFLVEGEHLILELEKAVQKNAALQGSELFVTENYQGWQTDFKKNLISAKQMAQISDTKTPQGIIAIVPLLSAVNLNRESPSLPTRGSIAADEKLDTRVRGYDDVRENNDAHVHRYDKERAIYLHEVQDPGNLGTILRTLAWFGNFRCLLSPGSVDPYNPKVVRASMGAIFHLPIELDVPLHSLPERFAHIACLDMQGSQLHDNAFKQFDCYVFGNEARGVPREQLTAIHAQPFTIAGCGAIESLNLASAVNMCAYELMRLP